MVSVLDGRIACRGKVVDHKLETIGGWDQGYTTVEGDRRAELTFWNEFMTLEFDGKREATFPDLITLISTETAMPLSRAHVSRDQEVAILVVPRENITLGTGILLPEALERVEKVIKKAIINP
jgi:DUF917 family protein